MMTLRQAIMNYLDMRRSLGFKLVQAGHWLMDYASFMEKQGVTYVTTELALQWALQPTNVTARYLFNRLEAVSGFARYWAVTDPRTEVPGPGLLPRHTLRTKPYLYDEADIKQLMQAASALPPRDSLNGATYSTLIGLLAVTGLRIGEALRLTDANVDLQQGVLSILGSKFGKSRLVPLHTSTRQALINYLEIRDRKLNHHAHERFFVSIVGGFLTPQMVRRTFCKLCCQVGLRKSTDRRGPRLHDFRHRFAMETLLQWYRAGEDIERLLPVLATFLGHRGVSNTYWYLSMSPELMGLAVQRLEQHGRKEP